MTTPDKEEMKTDMSSSLAVTVRDALEPFVNELNDYPVDIDGSTRIWDCQIRVRDLRNAAAAYDALSTLPVNDWHHSGSDSYQADASAPALSEKVNQPAVPQSFSTLLEICREASFLLDRLADLEFSDMDDLVRDYDCHVEPSISRLRKMLADNAPAKAFAANMGKLYAAAVHDLEASDADGVAIDGTDIRSFRKGYEEGCADMASNVSAVLGENFRPLFWKSYDEARAALIDGELTISNEAERTDVSLKPDTSSQPASEAGKLSTDEVR